MSPIHFSFHFFGCCFSPFHFLTFSLLTLATSAPAPPLAAVGLLLDGGIAVFCMCALGRKHGFISLSIIVCAHTHALTDNPHIHTGSQSAPLLFSLCFYLSLCVLSLSRTQPSRDGSLNYSSSSYCSSLLSFVSLSCCCRATATVAAGAGAAAVGSVSADMPWRTARVLSLHFSSSRTCSYIYMHIPIHITTRQSVSQPFFLTLLTLCLPLSFSLCFCVAFLVSFPSFISNCCSSSLHHSFFSLSLLLSFSLKY